jgi:hypothetical protein
LVGPRWRQHLAGDSLPVTPRKDPTAEMTGTEAGPPKRYYKRTEELNNIRGRFG